MFLFGQFWGIVIHCATYLNTVRIYLGLVWLKFMTAPLSSMWEEWGMFVFHDRGSHKLHFQYQKIIEAFSSTCFLNRTLLDCVICYLMTSVDFLISQNRVMCGDWRNTFGILIGKPTGLPHVSLMQAFQSLLNTSSVSV